MQAIREWRKAWQTVDQNMKAAPKPELVAAPC